MKELTDKINQSVKQFEAVIIPALPTVIQDKKDKKFMEQRHSELQRIAAAVNDSPLFSIRFLGDTQNGKSTLINVLLGDKILPEGHVGSCSATIVRCRYKKKDRPTIEFRYTNPEQFYKDLEEKCLDAEQALSEEDQEAKQRDMITKCLGRFLKLFEIPVNEINSNKELIERCKAAAVDFPEKGMLGEKEIITFRPDTAKKIHENLSARGRRAFIVEECLIEGNFPNWHPAMELVDMPGTNAANPWDDQVNSRLQQKIGGLAIITKETQLHSTVMDWFKETSILSDIVGASERNQVRVFLINTFVDKLNLDESEEETKWQKTQKYCQQIGNHIRQQLYELVGQRYSAENELAILQAFVNGLPIHYLSPKIYRSLSDYKTVREVQVNMMKHLDLAAAFQRFDNKPENTGVDTFRKDLYDQTESYVNSHFWNKMRMDFEKEVGLVARFFRGKRMGIEQRLADEGTFILKINEEVGGELLRSVGSHLEKCQTKFSTIKKRFNEEIGKLLEKVTKNFAIRTRRKLEDWMQLHWASLRCAGRKNGQHITARGFEIDFNGQLADFCVEALNSAWISHRGELRKQLLTDLRREMIPDLRVILSGAKGQDAKRTKFVEDTFDDIVKQAKENIDLQLEQYDSEVEEFDALRPKLVIQIRTFLTPTFEKISNEFGAGSSSRMRNNLQAGVLDSVQDIGSIVKKVVEKNWQGLMGAMQKRIDQIFDELKEGLTQQMDDLRSTATPSPNDVTLVKEYQKMENEMQNCLEKEAS